MTDRLFWTRLALLWIAISLLMVMLARGNIASNVLPDADDYMRLQQVRDLLAGQSWFDLHQYRYVAPVGAPMHWSRLVDLPIAALILMFKPFSGEIAAERIAEVIVPLLTLGCVMALVATITRRLVGERPALFAAALIPTAPLLWAQLQPLRIDHHGWQVVAALAVTLGLLDRRQRRGGLVAGVAAATGLSISVEGLPFAVAVGALFGWRWARDDRPGVVAYAIALAATSLVYFAATQPMSEWFASRCDSIASPYLSGFIVVAAGTAFAGRLSAPRRLRLALLAVIAAGGAAVMLVEPACRAGPLAQLDPLPQQWLHKFAEGRPIWEQTLPVAVMILGFPIFGLVGSWRARRRAEGRLRQNWTSLFLLQLASVAIAAMAQRAGATENALALPGAVALAGELLRRIDRLELLTARILVSLALVVLMIPLTLPAAVNILTSAAAASHRPKQRVGCTLPARVAGLDRLPAANVASTFDLSPIILSETHHQVLATGHHRNAQGMKDLILAFTGPPDAARAILERRDVRYLVLCRDSSEVGVFSQAGRGGLIDRLSHGRTPDWLRPLRLNAAPGLDIWAVG